MQEIVDILRKNNKTIATMESCTGGQIVNEITNIEGASDIIKFSAITYSNEYKIKMGVNKQVIDKYSVYSENTAMEMSKVICDYTNSNYGIGITGKLNRIDKYNNFGNDNEVFISIYDKDNNKFYNKKVIAKEENRIGNKKLILNEVINILKDIVKGENNG